jgi:hypothetical protein
MTKIFHTLAGLAWLAVTALLRLAWMMFEHFALGLANDKVIAWIDRLPLAATHGLIYLVVNWGPPVTLSVALLTWFLAARLRRASTKPAVTQPPTSPARRKTRIRIIVDNVEQEPTDTAPPSPDSGSTESSMPSRNPDVDVDIEVRTGGQRK